MFKRSFPIFKVLVVGCLWLAYSFQPEPRFISYSVELPQQLRFFWKNAKGERYRNFENLRKQLAAEDKQLLFATNGGMYQKDGSPLGLYIENFKTLNALNTRTSNYGNFYLAPNGVFYIQDNKGHISTTANFKANASIQFASQSGPMLLINGKMHPAFNQHSKHVHIRNGVGIKEDGSILFAMSKEKVTFYQLARFFESQGCKNALYLDGFVSRTYLPEKNWIQTDGNFGVMIGVTAPM